MTTSKNGPGTSLLRDCDVDSTVPPPRCTAAHVWRRAIAAGAPAAGTPASHSYLNDDGAAVWLCHIGDQPAQWIPEDC